MRVVIFFLLWCNFSWSEDRPVCPSCQQSDFLPLINLGQELMPILYGLNPSTFELSSYRVPFENFQAREALSDIEDSCLLGNCSLAPPQYRFIHAPACPCEATANLMSDNETFTNALDMFKSALSSTTSPTSEELEQCKEEGGGDSGSKPSPLFGIMISPPIGISPPRYHYDYECVQEVHLQKELEFLRGASFDQLLGLMRDRGIDTDVARSLAVLYGMLGAQDAASALALLKKEGGQLSRSDQMVMVQQMGAFLMAGYDKDRAAAILSAEGFADYGDLLQAGLYNNIYHVQETKKSGVCRDHAALQAKMLDTLGFDNTYIISYGTRRAYHTSVYSENPENDESYSLNYSSLVTNTGVTGPAALFRSGNVDHTLSYVISDPDGKSVGVVPSLRSLVVMLGINPQKVQEQYGYFQFKGNIDSAVIDLGENTELSYFKAEDELGCLYNGVGLATSYQQGIFQFDIGGAIYQEQFEDQFVGTISSTDLFAYFDLLVEKKIPLDWSGLNSMSIGALNSVKLLGGFEETGYWFASGDLFSDFFVGLNLANKQETVKFESEARLRVVPGLEDIRNLDVATLGPYVQSLTSDNKLSIRLMSEDEALETFMSPKGREQLASSPGGALYLNFMFTGILESYGTGFIAGTGLNNDNFDVSYEVRGNFNPDAPAFSAVGPYLEHSISAEVKITPQAKPIELFFEGGFSFSDNPVIPPALNLGGRISY